MYVSHFIIESEYFKREMFWQKVPRNTFWYDFLYFIWWR